MTSLRTDLRHVSPVAAAGQRSYFLGALNCDRSIRRPNAPLGRQLHDVPRSGVATAATAKQAMVAAAATPLAAFFSNPDAVFTGFTACVLPIYALMLIAPGAKLTRDVLQSPLLWAALGGLYCAALYHAWSSSLQAQVIAVFDASTKTLDMNAFAALFKDKMSALLIWIHLMVVDLLHAREVLLDGDRCGVFTGHSVVLCLFFGPIGLLSHLATKALTGLVRRMSSS